MIKHSLCCIAYLSTLEAKGGVEANKSLVKRDERVFIKQHKKIIVLKEKNTKLKEKNTILKEKNAIIKERLNSMKKLALEMNTLKKRYQNNSLFKDQETLTNSQEREKKSTSVQTPTKMQKLVIKSDYFSPYH